MKTLKNFVKAKLLGSTSAIAKDEQGGFAIMAAVSVGILVAGLAIAVDVSNGWFAKQRLQDTTDAIALLAARGQIETQAELDAAAQEYFNVTYPGADGSNIRLNSITRDGDVVTVTASNTIPTYFTGIFNRDGLDVGAASTAQYSNRNLDIALVLDTTYSMTEGRKINSLKTAATNLVNTFDTFENENLRVSVVPFAQYVNVGTSRRNAVWLDVPADETGTYQRRDVISRTNCRRVRRTGSRDGVPTTWYANKCDVVRGAPYTATWRETWKGCVGSRHTPWDTRAPYSGNKIPGLLRAKCGTEIRPLTDNLNQVKQTINALSANGNTYIPAGLAWGWRMLDNEVPFTEAASMPVADTDKVLVLMTDGENFNSKGGIRHDLKNRVDADNVTATMCENIKRGDIRVFTIAYDVTDTPTKNMLRNCATESANFFDATNASQLNDAFQEIGASLNELRITS